MLALKPTICLQQRGFTVHKHCTPIHCISTLCKLIIHYSKVREFILPVRCRKSQNNMYSRKSQYYTFLSTYRQLYIQTRHNPKARGNHPSTCSGIPISSCKTKAEPLRCLALRTRGGKLKSLFMYMYTFLSIYRQCTCNILTSLRARERCLSMGSSSSTGIPDAVVVVLK